MSKLKALLRRLGPGLITGASDDDPSGIATYAQAGAEYISVGALTHSVKALDHSLLLEEA